MAKIIGQLVIVAYKARYLPEREIVGKQDPFVVFRIGESLERTKTDIRGGQHPVWDDQVILPIPEKKNTVVVQVFDEDGKRQELISECDLDISKVLQEGEEDNWYPLQYKGRDGGEIYLEMTFYAARPPPKRQPTRFGVNRPVKHSGGYVSNVPPPSNQQSVNPNYPPQPTSVRPPQNQPNEGYNSQQQHPPFNYGNASHAYTSPNPTPSISTSSQHSYPSTNNQAYPPTNNQTYHPTNNQAYPPTNNQAYPPMNNRPYSGVQTPVNLNRPTSPPVPHPNSTALSHQNVPLHQHAPLLSSSYNPSNNLGYPSSGYPPQNYPPSNNRHSYPGYNSSVGYPPQNYEGGFPEPQHFSGGYAPHADNLGTPFAAHQGAYPTQHYPPNNTGYPPQQGGYPPNKNYPPY